MNTTRPVNNDPSETQLTNDQPQPTRLLRRSDLADLIDQEGPCVSIYLPMVRAGAETAQNPIRCKNALRAAREQLEQRGVEEECADALLAPALELLEEYDFWQNQSDGLAILLSEGVQRILRLPVDFHEEVVASDAFHLEQLLTILSRGGRFYCLSLSQNNVELFVCTRHRIARLDLPDAIPDSLADALGYDWEEKSLQFHGQQRVARGKEAIYHGHGAGQDDHEAELRRFFEVLDRGLMESLTDREVPMVLAGVEENTALFRKISKYPNLVEPTVRGNVDHLSPDELHERLVEAIGPLFGESLRAARDRFEELGGSDRVSTDLEEIVVAASDGRIETLFLPVGEHVYGRYDAARRGIEVFEEGNGNGDGQELLGHVARACLRTDSEIFAVPTEELPAAARESSGPAPVAAILRY